MKSKAELMKERRQALKASRLIEVRVWVEPEDENTVRKLDKSKEIKK